MTRRERDQLLAQTAEAGVNALIGKGYTFFSKTLVPELEYAGNISDADEGVLSDCWYIVGDVYDLVFALEKALDAYHRALDYDPEFAEAHLETALLLEKMGHYDEALDHIQQAEAFALEQDADIQPIKKRLESLVLHPLPAAVDPQNAPWTAYHSMAEGVFPSVITTLADQNDPIALRLKTCAYAALLQKDAFLENLRGLRKADAHYKPGYLEIFYIPETFYNQ